MPKDRPAHPKLILPDLVKQVLAETEGGNRGIKSTRGKDSFFSVYQTSFTIFLDWFFFH